jgi:hypothetical protein
MTMTTGRDPLIAGIEALALDIERDRRAARDWVGRRAVRGRSIGRTLIFVRQPVVRRRRGTPLAAIAATGHPVHGGEPT